MEAEIKERHHRMEAMVSTQSPDIKAEKASQAYRDRGTLLDLLEQARKQIQIERENCEYQVLEATKLRGEVKTLQARVGRLKAALEEAQIKAGASIA